MAPRVEFSPSPDARPLPRSRVFGRAAVGDVSGWRNMRPAGCGPSTPGLGIHRPQPKPEYSPDSADVAYFKRVSCNGMALELRRRQDVARGVGSVGIRPRLSSASMHKRGRGQAGDGRRPEKRAASSSPRPGRPARKERRGADNRPAAAADALPSRSGGSSVLRLEQGPALVDRPAGGPSVVVPRPAAEAPAHCRGR